MLLENDKVGPGIGSGIVAESVVWQTQRRHEVGTLHQLHPNERLASVHHTLGCYKSNQTTLAHLIERLEKEIVVY